jgi:predicted metal-dependent peptidase
MNAVVQEPIRLTELKVAMLLYVPFFASLMIDILELKVGKFPEVFGNNTPTAATDGKTVWIDEDFLKGLKLAEAVFLLCHEIAHCMWMHMARGKNYLDVGFDGANFNPSVWNMAGDYVINDMLVRSQIGDMPKGGLHEPRKYTHEMSADDVYRELMKDPPKQGQGGHGGTGTPDQHGNQGVTLDTHILKPQEIPEQEMRRAVKTASDAAKAQGSMPAALERFVTELMNPQVPWQEKLRYHVARSIGRDCKTWRSPNRRRLILQKIYMPSYTGFSAGEVVVAIDTSGSIGEGELNMFLSELAGILDDCKPEKVWVLAIDARVAAVTELDSGADIANDPPALKGGGGTSFRPAFEWCHENGIEPASLIYFTDMCGDFPKEAPSYPVIWCATMDSVAPWGETVRIGKEERA